ncbi:general amidase protein [Rutstroemia sp. NJR-2017a BBW]|nr:general amidase protein [Rutstroemia sp. NJR-2017a BBW]
MSSYWEVIASKRANSILDKIPLEWRLSQDDLAYAKSQKNLKTVIPRFLNEYERKIVKMDTMQILGMTQNGQWRVKDVVEAHCKIACIAHQIVWIYDSLFFSNFSVFFFHPTEKKALEKAERLDRQHKNNMPKGVLHGLPISLKDQFHVKGSDTTMGYVGWIGTFEGDGESEKVGRVDSEIVAQLESMGAVVFCKSTTNTAGKQKAIQ